MGIFVVEITNMGRVTYQKGTWWMDKNVKLKSEDVIMDSPKGRGVVWNSLMIAHGTEPNIFFTF